VDTVDLINNTKNVADQIQKIQYINKDRLYLNTYKDTTAQYISNNGGDTWTVLPKDRIYTFVGDNDCFCDKRYKTSDTTIGIKYILHSSDNLMTWDTIRLPAPYDSLRYVGFIGTYGKDTLAFDSYNLDTKLSSKLLLYDNYKTMSETIWQYSNVEQLTKLWLNSKDWWGVSNAGSGAVFRSNDGGITWDSVIKLHIQGTSTMTNYIAVRGDKILIGGGINYLAYSSDAGKNWIFENVQTERVDFSFWPKFITDHTAILCNWTSIYKLDLDQISGYQDPVKPNSEFKVYPNPSKAGESVFIHTDASLGGNILVEIYDLLGSKVYSNTFDDRAAWSNAMLLNLPSNLPVGKYSCRISNNSFSTTTAIVIE